MSGRRYNLSSGCLTLTLEANSPWAADDLFALAERRNPKRAFLFVSKVLGRHIPVSPERMRQVYQALARQLPSTDEQPWLFIGMAETAVGLAAGVFEEALKGHSNSLLLTSTRHPLPEARLLAAFQEEHSHATDHRLYWPTHAKAQVQIKAAKTWVLIDDEATTGNTFKNLIQALKAAGLSNVERIITITLTDWSNQALAKVIDEPVESIALLKGQWQWQAKAGVELPQLPHLPHSAPQLPAPLSGRQDWGRLGMTEPLSARLAAWLTAYQAQPNEQVLVLGTGEFVYPPFLLAEHLATLGACVHYSSTTRSPIAEGLGIESSLCFHDNYGLGLANYCYNIAHRRFDRIILCLETATHHLDPDFLAALHTLADQVDLAEYA